VIIISRDDGFIVTRLIGLPGETIEVSDRFTKINGSVVAEPYAVHSVGVYPLPVIPARKLPEGEIFVMGDNRDISYDSRVLEYGPVYTDDVVGRVSRIFWSDKRERIGKRIE
jgi:signal peptidase I